MLPLANKHGPGLRYRDAHRQSHLKISGAWKRNINNVHTHISVIFGDSNENREEVPQPQRRRDEERPQKTQHSNQRGNRGLETRGGGKPQSSSKGTALAGPRLQAVSSGWNAAISRGKRNSFDFPEHQWGGCHTASDEPMYLYYRNAFQPWHLTVSS